MNRIIQIILLTGLLLIAAGGALAIIFIIERLTARNSFASEVNQKNLPELVMQTGHSETVTAVVFGSRDEWIATASSDNSVKIWETETGSELRALKGHAGAVRALAVNPNANRLASGGDDKTVKVWDVRHGTEILSLAGHSDTIQTLVFSSDGTRLISGGADRAIFVWDASNGSLLEKFTEQEAVASSLAVSPDGQMLATGFDDGTLKIWSLADKSRSKVIAAKTGEITALGFSKDGKQIFSGGATGIIKVWNTAKGREQASFSIPDSKILSLRSGEANLLRAVSAKRTVKVWDTADKREISSQTLAGESKYEDDAESAALNAEGNLVLFGNGNRSATLFNAVDGKLSVTFENRTLGYYGLSFSRDNRWLAAANFDNSIKLWDLETGLSLARLTGHSGDVTAVAFHPNNRHLVSSSIDHSLKVWDISGVAPPTTLNGHTASVGTLAISPDGKFIVSGSVDKTVRVWKFGTTRERVVLRGHQGEVTAVAVDANAQMIASGGNDKTIRIWDTAESNSVKIMEIENTAVESLAFSPDNTRLAAGCADGKVRIWLVKDLILQQTLNVHNGKVYAVAFSPDGNLLASGGRDKTIRLSRVDNGRTVQTLNGHGETVFGLSFGFNGQWLASASADGSLAFWNYQAGEQIATLTALRGDNDWLVVTPFGFFDGSPAAWHEILWRFGNDTFNFNKVEAFFNEFYQPGILAKLLRGEKMKSASTIQQKDRRQPALKITAGDQALQTQIEDGKPTIAERQIKVRIDVSQTAQIAHGQSGSGAYDVRLFRNGSLIKLWSGEILDGKTPQAFLETTVTLVAGENRLTAYAFNRDNIKSADAFLNVKGSPNLQRKGTLYIVGIAVGKYSNPSFDLNYVELDAKEFAGQLSLKQIELNQFSQVELIPLTNENATKNNILAVLNRLNAGDKPVTSSDGNLWPLLSRLRPALPEDAVVVYFSGHGKAQNNRFYLLPHDLGYFNPNLPLTAERMAMILSRSVSDTELEAEFRDIDAGWLLLIIDACNSGQTLEAEDQRQGPMNAKGLAQLAYDKGMTILTASQANELAYVSGTLKHSYLTYALVEEALKSKAADLAPADGKLSLKEWFDFATVRVPHIRQQAIAARIAQEEGKGLEETGGKPSAKAINTAGIQRPRVFYRRQINERPIIVAQVGK